MDYEKNDRTVFFSSVPACTTKEVYDKWKEDARMAPPSKLIGFCEDCTPEYQGEMIRKFRCENPGIIFDVDDDGFVCGTLPTNKDAVWQRIVDRRKS